MSEDRFDLEEIIAEIKNEFPDKNTKSNAALKNDSADIPRRADSPSDSATVQKTAAASNRNTPFPRSDKGADHINKTSSSFSSEQNDLNSSIFKDDLDNIFSDDIQKKKPKKPKRAEIIEIENLSRNKTVKEEHAKEHRENKTASLPYDMVNRTYSDPEEAISVISKHLSSSFVKILVIFAIWALSVYLTLATPYSLPLPFGFSYFNMPFLFFLAFFVCDALALFLASEVTIPGIARLFKGKPTLDTLVTFASFASMVYIMTVLIFPKWGAWLPFTSNTVSLCLFAMIAKRRRFLSLKRTYHILQQNSSPSAVKADGARRSKTAYETSKNVFPDMDAVSSKDYTERLCGYYAPLAMLVCVALSVAASFGTHNPKAFPWCLSSLAVISVSPALIISSSLPSSITGRKLHSSGTSTVNMHTAFELSKCRSAVLTDEDIFPNGSIIINSLKIGDGFSLEEVYSVAASALEAIGGGLYYIFDTSAKQLYAPTMDVEDVRFFETGGMSAKVGSYYVHIGTASFLRRMGINIIRGVKLNNCLFVAIDSRFAGVFSLKYTAQPQVYTAFRMLRRAKTVPILAVRDFTTTQAFIEDKFKLHAEEADYPTAEERVKYSSDSFSDSEPLAVISNKSLFSFSELLLSCKKLYRSVVFNLICSFLGCIVGMLIMYFLVSNMEVSSASPVNVLVYLSCWTLPVWLSSLIFTAF